MAVVEAMGDQEYYANFIHVQGKRGTLLLFYGNDADGNMREDCDTATAEELKLAEEIGEVLDRAVVEEAPCQ